MGTDYLLKSARNASRLRESLAQVKQRQRLIEKPLLVVLRAAFYRLSPTGLLKRDGEINKQSNLITPPKNTGINDFG